MLLVFPCGRVLPSFNHASLERVNGTAETMGDGAGHLFAIYLLANRMYSAQLL